MGLFSIVVDGTPRNLIAAGSADAALAIAVALHGPDAPNSIEVCEQIAGNLHQNPQARSPEPCPSVTAPSASPAALS